MPLSRQRPATSRGSRPAGLIFDCVLVDETDEIACAASGADAPPQAAGIDQRLERHAAGRGLLVFGRPGFRLLAPAHPAPAPVPASLWWPPPMNPSSTSTGHSPPLPARSGLPLPARSLWRI